MFLPFRLVLSFVFLVGGAVINVPVSPWLLAFTGLLALFLVIGKRRQELVKLGAQAIHSRPSFQHYNLPLLDEMLRITTTATLITLHSLTSRSTR